MVQRTQITLIDDVDGSEADETVTFGLEGVAYEIDLTTPHAAELRAALATCVDAGRKVRGCGKKRGSSSPKHDPAAVREWATAIGHYVPERGRIPASLLEQYRAAN